MVTKMKATHAVIGGEGKCVIILKVITDDDVVGIALFLSHLAHEGRKSVNCVLLILLISLPRIALI